MTAVTPQATNWTGVAFGVALGVSAAYQMFKLPPALPLLFDRFAYDPMLAGGLMSVYALAGLALSLRFGRLLQRHAPAVLLWALAGLAAGNALGLVAPASGVATLVARGVEGVGFAALAVAGPAIATLNAAPRHLPIAVGLMAGWIPAGQLLANAAAGIALGAGAWQALWWGGLALAAAMAVWTLALARKRSVTFGVAGRETPAPTPVRPLLLAAATFCLWSTQFFAYMTWLPEYLVAAHGFSEAQAVAGYSVPITVLLVFNLVTGVALRAGAPLVPLLVGALMLQAAVWALLPVTGPGWGGAASLVAYGIGAGITPTCLFALPAAILGQARAGAGAFGVLMTGRNLGVLAGPLLLAAALRLSGDWHVAAPVCGAVTFGCALAALAVGRAIRDQG